jgi:hypothetical protein
MYHYLKGYLPSIVLAIKGIKSLLGVCKRGLDTAGKIGKKSAKIKECCMQ